MRESILDSDQKDRCYRCGRYGPTERHHIYGGANRKLSEKYGMVVHLCHQCHNEPPDGVHFNKQTNRWLQRLGQQAFMVKKDREDMEWEQAKEEFMKIFGRNYIDE